MYLITTIIEKLPVITGVSQASILGLFHFLVYINDLPAVCSTKSKIAIFADNTSNQIC